MRHDLVSRRVLLWMALGAALAMVLSSVNVTLRFLASPPKTVSAAQTVDPGSGTHGCVVADGASQAPPVVYSSDTSHIGGNACTFTVVQGATVGGDSSYLAAAQSWSIQSCAWVTVSDATDVNGSDIEEANDPNDTERYCQPDTAHSYSSAQGSSPVGLPPALVPGEEVTVTVSNGFVIAGTTNGATGA